jgi:uncharacterized protein (UPF0335 family)
LQDLITAAIKDYQERMEAVIERVERFDSETAQLLRSLSRELADLRSAQYAADPDVAAMLYQASQRLPDVDTAASLERAANLLRHFDTDAIDSLAKIAPLLGGLNANLIDHLAAVADQLARHQPAA